MPRILVLLLIALPLRALVIEPTDCLKKNLNHCLVKTQKRSETISWKESIVWLGKESMVEFRAEGLRVLQGHVWLQAKEETPFQSAFVAGTVKGDLWISQDPQKTLLRHLSGDLFLRLKTNSAVVDLPVGFENWYAGVQSDRGVYQGVLRAMPATEILGEWARTFRVSLKISTIQYEKWSETWSGNVDSASKIYQSSIDRHIASMDERARIQARLQEHKKEEDLRLKTLFRAKNAMDPMGHPFEGPISQDK